MMLAVLLHPMCHASCQPITTAQVDLVNWNQDERFGAYGGAHAMVLGGYGQLTDALASRVQNLHYSTPVAAIEATQNGVTVTTRNGTEHKGDIAIVAVPVGVLKAGSIAFAPPLPAWKQDALGHIGMGKLNKVPTERPWWTSACLISSACKPCREWACMLHTPSKLLHGPALPEYQEAQGLCSIILTTGLTQPPAYADLPRV